MEADRGAGGGGATRDEALRVGTVGACLTEISPRAPFAGTVFAVAEEERLGNAAEDTLPVVASETVAADFAGTLLFTKRCSFAS
jgi:hypothetical protein